MKSHQKSLFYFIIAFLAFSAINIALLTSLNAQPSLVHLSLAATEKSNATAPVIVTWCSDNTSDKQFVRYGLTNDRSKEMEAVKNEFDDEAVFSAELKNLKSGVKYYYSCGSDKAGWSAVYSFSTEPDRGTFRVGVIGDTQNNINNEEFQKTKGIVDMVKTYSPHLTLHMGDIVNDGSQKANWANFLSVTQDLNATSPLMPVLGNHDVVNEKGEDFQEPFQDFHSLFNLPGDEINYSFSYMNVRFIGINSGCAQAAAEIDQVKYKPGSPEFNWLDDELTKAENDVDIHWIIVWMHYPVNSFGWSNVARWKENILPLLEKHRVDLCLAGHRHVYERHLQVRNGIPGKNQSGSALDAREGTIFITNGTAGGSPTDPGGKDMPSIAFTPDRTMYNFAIMDIGNDSLIYSVFDQDNNLADKFIVKK
jgi:acid phosphatase type 7